MVFSLRSHLPNQTNALTQALERVRSRQVVLDLTVSNPTTTGLPYPQADILRALATPQVLTYQPEPFGLLYARQAIAADREACGCALEPARIVLTASTSEAYSFLFRLLCDPGDEVLVPAPSYPLFDVLAGFDNVRLVPYPLQYDGQWSIDLPALVAKLGPLSRAVVLVNPNNPTGSYLKRDELLGLCKLGLPLISDEVFSTFPLRADPDRVESVLEQTDCLAFSLRGLSKLAGLPQMKLAWIGVGGPSGVVQPVLERLEWIADAYLSVGTPVQHALQGLLASRGVVEKAIQARIRANHEHLRKTVKAAPMLSVLDTEGGWYATLELPKIQSEEEWTLGLLEQTGVYLHPGHYFDFPREAFWVLSLLVPEGFFAAGLERLIGFVQGEMER